MNTDRFRKMLLDKEQDLVNEIARLEREGRDPRDAEVQDPIDEVTSDEEKAAAFEESNIERATLRLVRDAIKRIDDGTYGICIDCGRQISESRLEAVPWTPYCRDDQEKHDRESCPRPKQL